MPDRPEASSSGSATPSLPCARSDGEVKNACPIGHRTASASTACSYCRPAATARTARSRSSHWCTAALMPGMPTSSCSPRILRDSGLATAGYAVFLPTPRGGVGHGRDFAAAVARSVGGSEWSDIISGIDLLIAEGVADPDRLGMGGARPWGLLAARGERG